MKTWNPESLASVLEQALADLKLVEKDERYVVDMGHFYKLYADAKCHVCLAGAVLAKTLENSPQNNIFVPAHPNSSALFALDYLRQGFIHRAFRRFYGDEKPYPAKLEHYWDVSGYFWDKGGFHRDMEALLAHLKEVGC